ncbi:hypothetical protein DICPUDRAFT_153434 [Dictyostelium purpureum]|uniref:Uncharacterized protein n=1 Tax=Dictyostelium purpureum TaxID=5786 RepID=F0ZNW6_DICPU|nr:uncharacterized protein DICPUDRAFT_153434 [Dictyostelium purpureum]EGC34380.1 hypothetical protein DICPUDRAFT_153434 [Dictyostelium purpureum]|eukprot:XP_003289114.1 hypothetical protein DICPUDRAFT_153434 [Dictyostelium purpureum]
MDINNIDNSNNMDSNNKNSDYKFNQILFDEISTIIFDVLKENINTDSEASNTNNNFIINKELLNKLLEDDQISDDDVFFNNEPNCKDIFNYKNPELFFDQLSNGGFYYPPKPFYKHIGLVLHSWATIKRFPIQFQPLYGLNEVKKSEQEKNNIYLDDSGSSDNSNSDNGNTDNSNNTNNDNNGNKEEKNDNEDSQKNEMVYFENLSDSVVDFINNKWGNGSKEEKKEFILNFFKNLTNRNLLTLFSIRKTKLSLDTVLLPGPIQLIKSSNLLNIPGSNSKLTVSSKALSKHSIRSKDSFWGSDKGPELVKNKRSESVLIKILAEPAWINIHLLPHNIQIIEIRNIQGYGLRWSADGTFFRGFLEPQMEGGHEVGWKH